MAYSRLLVEDLGAVRRITLNRPDKLNAWRGQMEQEVRAAMKAAAADDSAVSLRLRLTAAVISVSRRLPADAARAYLDSDEGADTVAAMDRRVRELGVTGVPFFIFGDRVAVSGAQEAPALVAAMEQALEADGV